MYFRKHNSTNLFCINFRANLFCPDSYNPADFYIKCVTVNSENEEDCCKKVDRLSDLFHKKFNPIKENCSSNEYFNYQK